MPIPINRKKATAPEAASIVTVEVYSGFPNVPIIARSRDRTDPTAPAQDILQSVIINGDLCLLAFTMFRIDQAASANVKIAMEIITIVFLAGLCRSQIVRNVMPHSTIPRAMIPAPLAFIVDISVCFLLLPIVIADSLMSPSTA